MNIRLWMFGFFWSVLVIAESCSAVTEGLPIPSVDEYSNFLLEPWKSNAPVLIIFTDPFCPYCIKALKRRDDLKAYNTYLFWYPIFGERSDKRVADIFQCSSPVSTQVISAVIAGKNPGCDGIQNENLTLLNRKMYEAYSPLGVPAYYMGGVKVSVAELKAWHKSVAAITSSVALDWSRYNINRLDASTGSLSKAILLLPSKYKKVKSLMPMLKTNTDYDWYLFHDGQRSAYKKTCQYLVGKCESQTLDQYVVTTQEIELLYDLKAISSPALILNGKILTDVEKIKYFGFLKDFF